MVSFFLKRKVVNEHFKNTYHRTSNMRESFRIIAMGVRLLHTEGFATLHTLAISVGEHWNKSSSDDLIAFEILSRSCFHAAQYSLLRSLDFLREKKSSLLTFLPGKKHTPGISHIKKTTIIQEKG